MFNTLRTRRSLPIIAALTLLALVAPEAAMASSGTSTNNTGINFGSVTDSVNNAIALMTGPVAKLVAVIAVLSGAFMLIQGKEMGEGIKTLAIIALTIGFLIGAVNIMNSVGATATSLVPAATGIFY